jgi:hypothetical protein
MANENLEAFVGRRAIYYEKPIYLAMMLDRVVTQGKHVQAAITKIPGSPVTHMDEAGATFIESSMFPDHWSLAWDMDEFDIDGNIWHWQVPPAPAWRLYFDDKLVDAFVARDPGWGKWFPSPSRKPWERT